MLYLLKKCIFTPSNKQKKINKMKNYKFTNPSEFSPQVMKYMLNNEVAEVELLNNPFIHVEVIKQNNKFNLVLNGKIVKQAVKFSTIEKHINKI